VRFIHSFNLSRVLLVGLALTFSAPAVARADQALSKLDQ
jgi:hypothetical protein